MVFEQLLRMLPADPSGALITAIVAFGIAIGSLTALLGAMHSRPTMAVLLLALGALLGFGVPRWLRWDVDPSVCICIGAIGCGLLGFLLHRMSVALALGTLVTIAVLLVFYDLTQPFDSLPPNQVQIEEPLPVIALNLWNAASPTFRSAAPWVAGSVFLVMAVIGYVFTKFGMALTYALGGTMMTLFFIRLGLASDKIHWLDSLRAGPMTTAALGMTMLAVGFLLQMALLFRPSHMEGKKQSPAE
jgi:hypothetical protein